MEQDLRGTDIFREASDLADQILHPGGDIISDIADLQRSSDAAKLLFTGTIVASLTEPATTHICEIDLDTGSIKTLTHGPNSDRYARLSPGGATIAFLSDRDRASDFQLFLLDAGSHALMRGPKVAGRVEYLQWSPDGQSILLGVAEHGAEISSGQGAHSTAEAGNDNPSWMPRVFDSAPDSLRRQLWIYHVASGALSAASTDGDNIWEANWCGNDRIAVVSSPNPEEGGWYQSRLALLDVRSDAVDELYTPEFQIALPRASPHGEHIVFVEALSSDREYVAGDLKIFDVRHRTCRTLDLGEVDVTSIEWRTDTVLLVAGHRGLDTVVVLVDVDNGQLTELWRATEVTTSDRYANVVGLCDTSDFAFVYEGFFHKPQVATIRGGVLRIAKSTFPENEAVQDAGTAEPVRWRSPDGLEIEGWLVRPACDPPYPTILAIHGGPVLHWRPYWLGRTPAYRMLLDRGYAIFLPNPRGSSGRGQAFAAAVVGDVGGADTFDFLSGIDHLVALGIADPARLGVTGLSYGGFMTCWLTTQDARFGAAIAVGPATNHVSQHLLCNIPQFQSLFLGDHYSNLAGTYYSRSPILHAHKSSTPTLLVCGDLDRCTPAEEAIQFHNALLENGVESVLIRYPEEGHGVHGIPAAIDFAARSVTWFEGHLRATKSAHDADE